MTQHIDTDPLTLDPVHCRDSIGRLILCSTFEPLLVRDSHGRVVGGAASRHVASSDGRSHVFYLRDDACWSDGRPVEAYDFEFSFRRLMEPSTGSSAGWLLAGIKNGYRVLTGRVPSDRLGVKAAGPKCLDISLDRGCNLESLLSNPSFSPLPRHLFPNSAEQFFPSVSNGPYTLVDYIKGKELILKPNPYWHCPPKLPGLRFWICDDLYKPLEEYAAGRVHVTCNTWFPFDYINEFTKYVDFHQTSSSILYTIFLNKNLVKGFRDLRVRRALHQAIDSKRLSMELHNGVLPWHHFLPARLLPPSMQTECLAAYAPGSAHRELACAGGVNRLPRSLKVLYADFYPNGGIVERIMQMWRDVLGVRAEPEPVSFQELDSRLVSGSYQMCLVLLYPMDNDPLAFLQYFLPDVPRNYQRKVVRLTRPKRHTGERFFDSQAVRRTDDLLQHILPALPICNGKFLYLKHPAVNGYDLLPNGDACFHELSFGKA